MPAETDPIVERHPSYYAWRQCFPDARRVAGFEGGAVYEAEGEEGFWLIKDEGAMADFLDPEDDADLLASMSMVRVERYASRSARDAAAQAVRDRRRSADDQAAS